MYEELNDYELLDQVADNEIATEVLFEKYRPLITYVAKKLFYANQNSGLDINDLIQEGMIGFSIAINTFDEHKDAKFFTYAKTCITRRIISAITAATRMKHQILNESISVDTLDNENNLEKMFSSQNSNPEDKLIDLESTKELKQKIIQELTDFENKVFELKTSGLNYKEIAEILEKDPKSIDNAISRIKAKANKYIN